VLDPLLKLVNLAANERLITATFGTNEMQSCVDRKSGRPSRWRHWHTRWIPNKIKMILVCSSQVVFGGAVGRHGGA